MKNCTHYSLALGLANLYTLIFITDPLFAWITFVLSFPLGVISFFPNFLDSYSTPNLRYQWEQLKHRPFIQYRHPLTHSPWTLGYFFPFYYITERMAEPLLVIFVFIAGLCWFSHLLLDSLNPEGIPLGKKAVYSLHPVKHYSWRQTTEARALSFARIPFNDPKMNTAVSRLGILLLTMNVSDLVLNNLHVISEVIFP